MANLTYPATVSEAVCARGSEEDIDRILGSLAKLEDQKAMIEDNPTQSKADRLSLIYNHLDLILDDIARYPVTIEPTKGEQGSAVRRLAQVPRPQDQSASARKVAELVLGCGFRAMSRMIPE